ncbi:MAG: TetR family transcriptional regulator [Acidimicrobiales bacterium]
MAAASQPSPGDQPTRRTEIGDESKQRILDAAERLFIERGVSATSFTRIEQEAGISRGSIPWHFKNKRGLLLSILDRAMLLSTHDVSDLAGRAGIRATMQRAAKRLHQPQAVLLAALLGESFQVDSDTHDRYRDFHAANRERLADLFRRSDDIVLPKGLDEDRLAALVFGAIMGIHLQYRLAPELVDLDGALEDLAELLDAAL